MALASISTKMDTNTKDNGSITCLMAEVRPTIPTKAAIMGNFSTTSVMGREFSCKKETSSKDSSLITSCKGMPRCRIQTERLTMANGR